MKRLPTDAAPITRIELEAEAAAVSSDGSDDMTGRDAGMRGRRLENGESGDDKGGEAQ